MIIDIMVPQISLDAWQIKHLENLLKKGSLVVMKNNMPLVLYRRPISESDLGLEETVCTLTSNFVIEQLLVTGGDLPPSFREQLVYTISEFPDILSKKSKERFLELIDDLEYKLNVDSDMDDF